MLMKVIGASILVHIVGAFIAGLVTIATIVIQDDAQFEPPPTVVEEEPPREVKVVIRPEQAKVPQTQRLRMQPVANIAVADVDVNLPDMDQSFTVSAGLGGVGGGRGSRGLVGVGDIVKRHWQTYGRNYYSRYDYETVDAVAAARMLERLRGLGDLFGLPHAAQREIGADCVQGSGFFLPKVIEHRGINNAWCNAVNSNRGEFGR